MRSRLSETGMFLTMSLVLWLCTPPVGGCISSIQPQKCCIALVGILRLCLLQCVAFVCVCGDASRKTFVLDCVPESSYI